MKIYKFALFYRDYEDTVILYNLEKKPLLFNSVDEAIEFRNNNDLSLIHEDHHYYLKKDLEAPSTVPYFVSKPNITSLVIMKDVCSIQLYETYEHKDGVLIKTSKF